MNRERVWPGLMIVVLMLFPPVSIQAEVVAYASVPVFVAVEPSVIVMPLEPELDLGSVQIGDVSGWIPYRVDANVSTLKISVVASYLFDGADVGKRLDDPILLNLEQGVAIVATSARPAAGEDNIADYSSPATAEGLAGYATDWVKFESGQGNRFSQEVRLEVTWRQPDPEKASGEYRGVVELWALVSDGIALNP